MSSFQSCGPNILVIFPRELHDPRTIMKKIITVQETVHMNKNDSSVTLILSGITSSSSSRWRVDGLHVRSTQAEQWLSTINSAV